MTGLREKRRYFLAAAAILWMAIIFAFSQQKAEQSGQVSGTITYRMAEGINEAFSLEWEEDTLLWYAQAWQHPVRKTAHMAEYAVLGCLLLANAVQYDFFRKRAYFWAWLGATVYAVTDEAHQLFIEGRSCELKDVCIDSTGAAIGALSAWGALCLWRVVRRKQMG